MARAIFARLRTFSEIGCFGDLRFGVVGAMAGGSVFGALVDACMFVPSLCASGARDGN